ncbi:MAG: putative threonine efflux protein [Planctomycetota bacterium]|nr:MAG: putative threonine efflux protein [Planctomycetota bacterium]
MAALYRLTADLVVVVHFTFVAFVVFGLLLTLLGGVRRWEWVRGVRFRAIHLAAIGFVVAESLCGVTCPLTMWEQHLRDLAGQASYQGDFIATWVHDLMFFDAEPWVFTLCYCVFGAVVAMSWLLVPPRLQRRENAANVSMR